MGTWAREASSAKSGSKLVRFDSSPNVILCCPFVIPKQLVIAWGSTDPRIPIPTTYSSKAFKAISYSVNEEASSPA